MLKRRLRTTAVQNFLKKSFKVLAQTLEASFHTLELLNFAVCMWPFSLLFYSLIISLYLPFSKFLSACLSCFCVFVFLSAVLKYGMRSGHALEMMVPQRPAVNIPQRHTHHSACRHLGHKHIVPSCIKYYPSVIYAFVCSWSCQGLIVLPQPDQLVFQREHLHLSPAPFSAVRSEVVDRAGVGYLLGTPLLCTLTLMVDPTEI